QWRARAGRTPSPPRAAVDARRARSRRHLLPSSFGDLTAAAQVAQHDLLELDVVHLPACVVETAVRAHEQRRLSLRVTLVDDRVEATDRRGVRSCAGQDTLAGDDVVDRTRE